MSYAGIQQTLVNLVPDDIDCSKLLTAQHILGILYYVIELKTIWAVEHITR